MTPQNIESFLTHHNFEAALDHCLQFGIYLIEMYVWWYDALGVRHQYFAEAGYTRCRLGVSQVRLYGSNQ